MPTRSAIYASVCVRARARARFHFRHDSKRACEYLMNMNVLMFSVFALFPQLTARGDAIALMSSCSAPGAIE